ncbi:hypothetical protein HI914_04311 [Erysiphe necator]|nr:hypothetical protein HI914_04311 [Erysiphe necator]
MPVPTENALRILRNIALGTSCTMAFIFGILLDERQRLLQTAHRTRRNIKILKSSKRYTTKGASAIRAFEEKALRFDDDITADKLQSDLSPSVAKSIISQSTVAEGEGTAAISKLSNLESPNDIITYHDCEPCGQLQLRKLNSVRVLSTSPSIQRKEDISFLTVLEQRISYFLDQSPPQVETAAKIFIGTLENGLEFNGASFTVFDNFKALSLALALFRACTREFRLDISKRIFYSVMICAINERIFITFQLEKIIEKLMNGVSPQNINEIASLYFATLDRYTESISSQLLVLGHKLCETAFKYGKYQFVQETFRRMIKLCSKFPIGSLSYFIIAASHEQDYQSEVFEYFMKYFANTIPSENHHNKVVKVIVNHLLANRMFAEAEQVIATAENISRKSGYFSPATPCLILIRKNWEVYQDLDKTVALFDRVGYYIQSVRNQCVFYDIIIKICIEADDTLLAWSYYNKSQKKNCLKAQCILVQSTLLKAHQGDFEGVKNDLEKIDNVEIADKYSKLFPKILKIFSSKNDMTSVENFIELAFKMGISLNSNSINKIAELYAKERNFESIVCLLHYATNKGYPIDASFINMILKQSNDSWKYSIEKVLLLARIIIELDSHNPIIDCNTFLVLRRLISSNRRASIKWKNKISEKLNLMFEPYHFEQKNPFNPNHILSEMVVSLNLNDPQETLAIYDWARSEDVRIGSKHLNVAVEASFRYYNGDISEGMKRVRKSGLSGAQTAESIALLFVHHLQSLANKKTNSAEDIVQLTLSFISSFEKHNFQIPIQVITQTISTLERLRKYYDVGTFWDLVSNRLGLHLVKPNIETLTVFLNTYIKLEYVPGFWKIFQIMIKNRVFPDQRFCLTLDNARRRVSLELRSPIKSNPQKSAFLDTILEGRTLVKQIRSQNFSERHIGTTKVIKKIEENLRLLKSPD